MLYFWPEWDCTLLFIRDVLRPPIKNQLYFGIAKSFPTGMQTIVAEPSYDNDGGVDGGYW